MGKQLSGGFASSEYDFIFARYAMSQMTDDEIPVIYVYAKKLPHGQTRVKSHRRIH